MTAGRPIAPGTPGPVARHVPDASQALTIYAPPTRGSPTPSFANEGRSPSLLVDVDCGFAIPASGRAALPRRALFKAGRRTRKVPSPGRGSGRGSRFACIPVCDPSSQNACGKGHFGGSRTAGPPMSETKNGDVPSSDALAARPLRARSTSSTGSPSARVLVFRRAPPLASCRGRYIGRGAVVLWATAAPSSVPVHRRLRRRSPTPIPGVGRPGCLQLPRRRQWQSSAAALPQGRYLSFTLW